jgi:Xaa-Pro aminopeptidase
MIAADSFIQNPDQYVERAFEYHLEPGIMLCVEALISPAGGSFSINLEKQVLITEIGCDNLTVICLTNDYWGRDLLWRTAANY